MPKNKDSDRKRVYIERRVYFGKCSNCPRLYKSYHRKRIKAKMCGVCRRLGISKDQIPLFVA